MKIVILTIFSFALGLDLQATEMPPAQLRGLMMMQSQMQINQISADLNSKLQKRNDLKSELKEINSALKLSQTFYLSFKIKKLSQDQKMVQNDLKNLEIEITELQKIKDELIKNNFKSNNNKK